MLLMKVKCKENAINNRVMLSINRLMQSILNVKTRGKCKQNPWLCSAIWWGGVEDAKRTTFILYEFVWWEACRWQVGLRYTVCTYSVVPAWRRGSSQRQPWNCCRPCIVHVPWVSRCFFQRCHWQQKRADESYTENVSKRTRSWNINELSEIPIPQSTSKTTLINEDVWWLGSTCWHGCAKTYKLRITESITDMNQNLMAPTTLVHIGVGPVRGTWDQ